MIAPRFHVCVFPPFSFMRRTSAADSLQQYPLPSSPPSPESTHQHFLHTALVFLYLPFAPLREALPLLRHTPRAIPSPPIHAGTTHLIQAVAFCQATASPPSISTLRLSNRPATTNGHNALSDTGSKTRKRSRIRLAARRPATPHTNEVSSRSPADHPPLRPVNPPHYNPSASVKSVVKSPLNLPFTPPFSPFLKSHRPKKGHPSHPRKIRCNLP
jgi:hypothetical protein